MTTPRRFLSSTPAKGGTDSPANLRFQATGETPTGSADPHFARVPKFLVRDRRIGRAQEQSKESLNDSLKPLDNGNHDSIQDPSSEESSIAQNTERHATAEEPEDEMLFDTFVNPPESSPGTSSPVRKRQRTDYLGSAMPGTDGAAMPVKSSPMPKATA